MNLNHNLLIRSTFNSGKAGQEEKWQSKVQI